MKIRDMHLNGDYRHEVRALLGIALPLIFSALVSMGMSITDVIMIGWLGKTELAASAAVSDFYSLCFYFMAGIVAATSPLIAQAKAKKDILAVKHITHQGFIVSAALSIPGALLIYNTDLLLIFIGVPESIVNTGTPYATMMTFTFVAMLIGNTSHYFLACHNKTHIIFTVTLLALPINGFANYCFIFGNFGCGALNLAGAGLASALTAAFMSLSLFGYILLKNDFQHYEIKRISYSLNIIGSIFRLGLPIGVSNLGIMGVFLLTTVTVGIFGVENLAAHTVTLRVAGIVFAVPLGFSQAATVRVAFAIATGNLRRLYSTIICVLGISITLGSLLMLLIIVFRLEITAFFFDPPLSAATLYLTTTLLTLMAVGQPINNLSFVGNGILRGINDTKMPMYISVISFWGTGFAGGWILAMLFHYDGLGIWLGLVFGEIFYAVLITLRLYSWFAFTKIRVRLKPLLPLTN